MYVYMHTHVHTQIDTYMQRGARIHILSFCLSRVFARRGKNMCMYVCMYASSGMHMLHSMYGLERSMNADAKCVQTHVRKCTCTCMNVHARA